MPAKICGLWGIRVLKHILKASLLPEFEDAGASS